MNPGIILRGFFGGFIGGCLGMILWLNSLESEQMSGIIFRQNETGENVFTPQNILLYMAAPFQYPFFWYPPFLQHNWIVMTSCGIAIGAFCFIFL